MIKNFNEFINESASTQVSKTKTTMTQETIYLCYEADKWISRDSKQLAYIGWISRDSKQLAYIGTDLEDCIAQLVAYFELNETNEEELRTNLQTISQRGYGYIIEEERTNCFINGFRYGKEYPNK